MQILSYMFTFHTLPDHHGVCVSVQNQLMIRINVVQNISL